MEKTYVSKRFRTFRRPIRRKLAQGGIVARPGMYLVGKGGPEIVIPYRTTLTGGTLPRNLIYTTVTLSA